MNTIGGPNKKSGTQKFCVDCEIELIPGINCYTSQYKRHIYLCKSCRSIRAKDEHIKYWALPHWRDKKKEYVRDYRSEEKPGVYFIRYYDQIIYIGESKTPIARRVNHFSKYKNKNNYQNPIQLALLNGELDRRHLSFEVIDETDGAASGTLHLYDPSNTTFVKHFNSTVTSMQDTPFTRTDYVGGYGNTTSAINAVQFKMASGNIDSGVIKLYGVS